MLLVEIVCLTETDWSAQQSRLRPELPNRQSLGTHFISQYITPAAHALRIFAAGADPVSVSSCWPNALQHGLPDMLACCLA